VRLTLPDGTRVLGVHASPGRDDGPGIQLNHSNDQLEQRMAGCEADLVIVGHTHVPLDRHVGRVYVVNLGSVSNPVTQGLQATEKPEGALSERIPKQKEIRVRPHQRCHFSPLMRYHHVADRTGHPATPAQRDVLLQHNNRRGATRRWHPSPRALRLRPLPLLVL
jgi:hypothetical protein